MCPVCLSAIAAYSAGSGGIVLLASKVRGIVQLKQAAPQVDLKQDKEMTDGGMSHVGTTKLSVRRPLERP